MARPSRKDEVDTVCRLAGCTPASVRNFFTRPGRLSAELRQLIASAVAEVGYRPLHPGRGVLEGARLGYQLPRTWSSASPNDVMTKTFQELVLASQRQGAALIPVIVDPFVMGVSDVSAGTDQEQTDDLLALQGWHRRYAESLAPAEYQRMMRKFGVQGFFVNDLLVDDRRLQALHDWGIPYVAMGRSMRTVQEVVVDDDSHPSVETDNRAGIAKMVQLLRGAGCHTFAHLGFVFDDSVVPYDRMAAVRAAVGQSVAPLRLHYEKIDLERDANVGAVAAWLNDNQMVDAVICDSDGLADLLRSAAPQAGRHLVRNLDAHDVAGSDRPLMACGNDDNPVRRTSRAESTWWMTMHGDRPNQVRRTVELMASRLHSGSIAPISVLVPPIIVGAPGRGPTEETSIDL